MDDPQEYEVESVTRARCLGKKGKKIVWEYYVKWKGYEWKDSTWEPTDSFRDGSEHILESFWERIDTGGRDLADATAFKKGEEFLVSGPPGRKLRKRKLNPAQALAPSAKDVPSSNGATISAPLLSPRKRRRVQSTADDERGYSGSKQSVSTIVQGDGQRSARPRKRRRASSPGPRKSTRKRQASPGDSQLDADGETDPDAVEVEDELMQVSTEDAEEYTTRTRHLDTECKNPNGSKEITFDDLEHFYSGNPIDIDPNAEDQVVVQVPNALPQPQTLVSASSPPPTDVAPVSEAPASPTGSSYDPLFDSPPDPSDKTPEAQKTLILPRHRTRAVKPLVKLIDATTLESTSKHSRLTAKARLTSVRATSGAGPSGNVAERGGKPGPGRSSSGLITRHRSSLLTAAKGTLKSVKGKFRSATERDQPDEIEAAPVVSEGDKLLVASWSDEEVVDRDHRTTLNTEPAAPPSGGELLKLAGLTTDPEPLPDYEDDPAARPLEAKETKVLDIASTPTEQPLNQSFEEVKEESKTSNHITDPLPSVSSVQQEASTPTIDNSAEVALQVDEAVKKNIELAKENLFPPAQTSFDSFSTTQSSFCSTIFGPLYQGTAANCAPAAKNESSTTFKVRFSDGVELPLALEDCNEITRTSDILIGQSSGARVAIFYSSEDALPMVSSLKRDGTARVILDPSAEEKHQDRFSTFLQRFQSLDTLIGPVGSEVCVLYSAENAGIAEKLGTPAHLRGLANTLLISHASIENQLAYVGAIMKATAL